MKAKSGKDPKGVIKRDFTRNDSNEQTTKNPIRKKEPERHRFPSPPKPVPFDELDQKKLLRISEMMKQESLHFCKRLEKQIRILADVSGLSSTGPFRFDITNPGRI